jgi:guanylate kinase
MISQGAFVEYTPDGELRLSTTKRAFIDQAAKELVVLMPMNAQGYHQMRTSPGFDARYVFVKPQCLEVLEKRARNMDYFTEEQLQNLLDYAQEECESISAANAHDAVIINDSIDVAFQSLVSFIYTR